MKPYIDFLSESFWNPVTVFRSSDISADLLGRLEAPLFFIGLDLLFFALAP